MAMRAAKDLRISADILREMASDGSDVSLHAALRLLAEEFEQEADRIDILDEQVPKVAVSTGR